MATATVTVIGRLTRDVEKNSDSAPFKSSIAVDGLVKVGNDYKTKFFNLTVWPTKADGTGGSKAYDLIKRMGDKGNVLKKGSLVVVTGSLQYEVGKDREGVEREYDNIVVDRIDFIPESKREAGTAGSTNGNEVASTETSGNGGLAVDEDIPLL